MNPIREIEVYGYTRLKSVYSIEECEKALELVKYWEKFSPNEENNYEIPRLNKGQPNIYNLQNKDMFFINMLFKSEEIEKILIYFLNDKFYKQISSENPNYILRAMGARSSKAALPFHIDSFFPYKGKFVGVIQMAIFLENSTKDNGATSVIKGSHQSGEYATNPPKGKSTIIEAKQGDVVLWDSRLHHATTENKTDKTRWAIVSTFSRWNFKQMFDIPRALPENIYTQLSPKQRSILGFNSVPLIDESFGIEMKKGY